MLIRTGVGGLLAVVVLLLVPGSAARADIGGPVGCDPADAYCTVVSTSPDSGGTGGGTTTTVACHNLTMDAIEPCYDPDLGWVGPDGCYYKQRPDGKIPPSPGPPGHWYTRSCIGSGGAISGAAWIVDNKAPGPAQLARIAESLMTMPRPSIQLSPPNSAMQIVGVPTWLWLPKDSYTQQNASAGVPGMKVTAYATPVKAVWHTGDGATVTCTGRGTEWTSADSPTKPSPTCGHTYTRSSAGQPGNTFTVTVTVTWQITWTVNGAAGGTLGDLTTSNTVNIPVGQAEAVITG
jgi:hypothetical protein